ncbi:FK506 binding protein [Aureococcus anophagefferens]|nr:FK506 binding protein [Aureococcus anophagefferens]
MCVRALVLFALAQCSAAIKATAASADQKAFLEKYAAEEGAVTKDSGLIYKVIKAWTEAMQEMKVGAKWELVCPPEIAYGSRAMGADIPANSVLVFTMEMLSCQGVQAEL